MKKSLVVILITGALLGGCGGGNDGDGVPIVNDPHHPVDAGGQPINGTEFVKKYCAGKLTNVTCAKVKQAVNTDSTKGGVPKGW